MITKTNRTLLVGLDAACWDYLQPLLDAGRLPHVQRLLQYGIHGTLHSTMPAWTPTAWSSLITGKNPGKHGVFDMTVVRPGSYEPQLATSMLRQGTPFWKRLNDAGLRVGLVNVPFTFPVHPVDGFVIAGFGTPYDARSFCFPEEIQAELGDFRPVVDPRLLTDGAPEAVFAAEKAHQSRLTTLALKYAAEYEVDVLVINLMFPDHANHKMPALAQVEEAIVATDVELGRLLDGFQPAHTLLFSDHGATRSRGNFLLQQWLRDEGYLVAQPRTPQQMRREVNWMLHLWLQGKGLGRVRELLFRRLLLLLTYGPRALRAGLLRHLAQHIPFAADAARLTNRPDFSRTQVFTGTIFSGLIYVNSIGRFTPGVVAGSRGSALVAELREKLLAIRDPDSGEPVFEQVHTAAELYRGGAMGRAPDLVLDGYESGWNIQMSGYAPQIGKARDGYFLPPSEYGWHSKDGILVAVGEPFATGRLPAPARLLDLTATLLYLHDVAVPDDYDSQVIESLFPAVLRAQRPVRSQNGDLPVDLDSAPGLQHGESQAVLDHLRALGYVD